MTKDGLEMFLVIDAADPLEMFWVIGEANDFFK